MAATNFSNGKYFFTSESVSDGHPDKVADQISDAIVDLYLHEDPQSRVAAETIVTTNWVAVCGEVRGPDSIDEAEIERVVRKTIRDIGYEQEGFHWAKAEILVRLHKQSADIARGVDEATNKAEGAGDQGLMFGYAKNETSSYMPAPITFAHTILRKIAEDRRAGKLPLLGPDAKSQVTLQYANGKPVCADRVVVSVQHAEEIDQAGVRELIRPYVEATLPQGWMPKENHFYVNPTGRFVVGGPDGDTGLTGRKIIVDTYGGSAPHGGGAFSGKDPTKVDRSAAYAARYLAKNVVASGIADECTIQLSYAIGVSEPLSFYVNTHGTNKVNVVRLPNLLRELVDLSPRGIREHLQLNRPIYQKTAAFGHFGREPERDGAFSWERTDLVPAIRSAFNLKI